MSQIGCAKRAFPTATDKFNRKDVIYLEPLSLKTLLAGVAETAGDEMVRAVVTDSRAAGPETVFVAIKGERVDGHDYAATALAQGAGRCRRGSGEPTKLARARRDLVERRLSLVAAGVRRHVDPHLMGQHTRRRCFGQAIGNQE